jgi:hypothetical protein
LGKQIIKPLAVSNLILLSAFITFTACGHKAVESGGGFYGDEVYVPLDRGGAGIVTGDLPVYADPEGDEPKIVLRKGEFAYLAAAYNATTGARSICYGEKLDEGEPEVGWVKDVTADQFELYCYIVSDDVKILNNPGDESGFVTALQLGDFLTVFNEAKKVGETTWVKVGKSGVNGWVRLKDVAYGDVAFSKNAYTYSKRSKSEKVIECLKKAEMSGAFVDWENKNGPWVARVPGEFFRVFGAGYDIEIKVASGGPVAVGPHGRYLAYTTDKNGVNSLHVVDLKTNLTIYEADYVDDFKWSPLGQFLAYREGMDGIYSVQFFWTERGTSIASARLAGNYAWSPDGYLLAFTGARENKSVDFYVEPTDELPGDNLLTTVEVYDPFGLLGDVILKSDVAKKYEFAGWESRSGLNISVTAGEVDASGSLRYIGKPSTKTVLFDRTRLHAGGHQYWKELEAKSNEKLKSAPDEIREVKPDEPDKQIKESE